MPVRKGGARRRRKADLTEPQFWELCIGPGLVEPDGTDLGDGLGCRSAFDSEAERKAAWLYHRAALFEAWPGRVNPLWGERTYGKATS
jgi:hypothetical protein